MEHDEPKPFEYSIVEFFNNIVAYFLVGHVAPPNQDVGLFQHFVRQLMFGFIECCSLHDNGASKAMAKCIGYGNVNAFGIDCLHQVIGLFVPKFVPHRDMDGRFGDFV